MKRKLIDVMIVAAPFAVVLSALMTLFRRLVNEQSVWFNVVYPVTMLIIVVASFGAFLIYRILVPKKED